VAAHDAARWDRQQVAERAALPVADGYKQGRRAERAGPLPERSPEAHLVADFAKISAAVEDQL
jgi:hypothetical protein